MLRPRRISTSHRDAFLERYEGLHSWAVQMTGGDSALAGDLLHDLFILFTLSQPDLNRIENLDFYLYASLRNLHISQLRRATRGRFEQLSVVEYESARLSLHSISHGRDSVQVQDELRRVCHYACARKETANAASVLILRFFHGYYPSEIAKIIRSTRRAVDDRLRAVRTEANAYLEDPKALTVINAPDEPVRPEVFPARFARTPGDFLLELQQTIFNSRQGKCSTREEIKSLYEAGQHGTMECTRLAHIASCAVCLDTVNTLLGLPLLAERYPTDTMDKDNKKGGGPPDDGDKGGAVRRLLKDWEREAREAFEHKPQELCVSVNGYLLGSQLIGAELSELTLNVSADERISFCEVFSEQGIRLMMMNVEELPPNGPGELHQRIELSEARTLESALLFSNPFPTLHVTYHDPAMAIEVATDAEVAEAGATSLASASQDRSKTRQRVASAIKKLGKPISALVQALRARFLNLHFWLRPAPVTGLIAVLLIAAVVFLELRGPAPVVTAAALLQRAALAEEALASNRNQVLHRTINLEERAASGDVIARRRIEVWQSAANGVSARRLFDEKGSLIAGDWRRSDGVQTLYNHGSRPQLKQAPDARGGVSAINFESAWQFLPSAKDFTSLIGRPENVRVEERASDYLISYSRDESGGEANGVLKLALVLSRTDLHATEQMLTLRKGNEVREYRMMETSFERRSADAVEPKVFEPDPELVASTAATSIVGNKSSLEPERLPVPAPGPATRDLEVEVLRLLSETKADLGEQVSLTRTADGKLLVQGIVDSSERKTEILQALKPVTSNPWLRVEISSVSEALGRQEPAASSSTIVNRVEVPEGSTIPVYRDVREYFSLKGISNDRIDEEIRQYSNRVLSRSRQALRHAWALKRLAERFTPEDLKALSAEARAKWLAMIREHAQGFQQETEQLHLELQPIFFRSGPSSGPKDEMEISNESDFIRALARLAEVASTNDEAMRSAFTISAGSGAFSIIKTPQFSRSVASAEKLAARIQAQAERTPDNQH